MAKEPTKLQIAQMRAEEAAKKTNEKINEIGAYASSLNTTLTDIQSLFDRIRNVPTEERIRYEKLKAVRVNWKQQAEKIEAEYNKLMDRATDQGIVGVGSGVAVAALGPSAAMGVATTFGVASTGTAISALSGAAATNAALAWLGGGALAAGGGGMAAGSTFLALAGPVGWGIAVVSALTSAVIYFRSKKNKERLEDVYTRISIRDVKTYKLAYVELCKRIERMRDERTKLEEAIERIKTFGTDYDKMTIDQQYELGLYVNLMEAATMLLVDPILGLQSKYTEQDFERLWSEAEYLKTKAYYYKHKNMIITLANLLYKIELDENDKKILAKSLNKNKDFKKSVYMDNEDFEDVHITMVEEILDKRYKYRTY